MLFQIGNLTHAVVSPTRFRCEYRYQGYTAHNIFSGKLVKFQADILKVNTDLDLIQDKSLQSDSRLTFDCPKQRKTLPFHVELSAVGIVCVKMS